MRWADGVRTEDKYIVFDRLFGVREGLGTLPS